MLSLPGNLVASILVLSSDLGPGVDLARSSRPGSGLGLARRRCGHLMDELGSDWREIIPDLW